MRKDTGLRWLAVTFVVFSMDLLTKTLAIHFLDLYEVQPVIPSLNFLLVYNQGAAFSFLDKAGGWQHFFLGGIAFAISIALTVWLYRLSVKEWWLGIALSLILGGALGNLWDRIHHGYVIDFIQLYVHISRYWYWPVFNFADMSICLGAFMLLWHWGFHRD